VHGSRTIAAAVLWRRSRHGRFGQPLRFGQTAACGGKLDGHSCRRLGARPCLCFWRTVTFVMIKKRSCHESQST
jgi:hypothetical protein